MELPGGEQPGTEAGKEQEVALHPTREGLAGSAKREGEGGGSLAPEISMCHGDYILLKPM